jgi:hypothetical protein
MTGPAGTLAPSLMDEVLPRYETREVHDISVAAPRAEVYRALDGLTLGELHLFRALLGVRALPGRLARSRRRPDTPSRPNRVDPRARLLDWGLGTGFAVLASRPGSELVIGAAGQPWRPAGGAVAAIRDRDDFVAFDRPGFAKVAIGFRLEELPGGGTRVVTETRVDTTDPLTHRRFGTYWKVIRVWSGAIRQSWLRAIRRRAERGSRRAGVGSPALSSHGA